MKKIVSFCESHRLLLAVWLSLIATPALRAGVTFTNTPATIGNAYTGLITLQIAGLNPGETVLVQKFLDLNNNGVVDAPDYLVGQINLTDGQAGMVFGGVTNATVPGDDDTIAGQITAKIDLALTGFEQTIIGHFAFVVSSPTARFTPVTNWFSVTNTSYSQSISGHVMNAGTNVPNSILLLLALKSGGNASPVGGVVTDGSGGFTIEATPGTYGLVGVKEGFAASVATAPFVNLNGGQSITTNVFLSPPSQSISGSLVDANNSAIRFPGVLVAGESSAGFLSIAYTDANGNFTLATTPGTWKVNPQAADIAVHGYVSPGNAVRVNSSGGSVSGVILAYTKATAMFYGKVTDGSGNPLPGIDIYSDDNGSSYGIDSYSDANGNYYCGVVGALGTNDLWYISPSNDSNPANLFFSQPDFDQYGGTNVAAGQAVLANFTAVVATNQIAGTVRDSQGKPIAGVGVSANATINGANFNLNSVDTDTNGNYTLTAANGDWNVFVFCQGGNDSLDSIYGPGNYQCPNNQNVTINNANGTANFTVTLQSYNTFLSGQVIDNGGNPVGNINLFAFSADGGTTYGATTDANGNFHMGVNPDVFQLQLNTGQTDGAGSRGLVSPSIPLTVDSGISISNLVLIAQRTSGSITVSVTNATANAGVGGIKVVADIAFNGTNYTTGTQPTSPAGTVALGVFNGTWTVSANCNDLAGQGLGCPNNQNTTVNNNVGAINFTVQPAGSYQIYGYVRDTGNNPVANVQVNASGPSSLTASTDNDGYYSFNVGNGNWDVGVDCNQLAARGYGCASDEQVNIANGSSEADFTVSPCEPLAITTYATLPDADATFNYSLTLQNVGCNAPFTWSLTPGSLAPPPGLTLNPAGVISGTPSTNGIGTNYFSLRVTDSTGNTADELVSLAVYPAPQITNSSLPNAILSTFYSVQLGSTGGDGGLFGWNIVSGALPPGLNITLDGDIEGTPSQTGTFTFTVGGVDNAGSQPQKTLSITVINSLQVTTTSLTPGYTGTPYSVQLQASGGKTPYTWSIALGSQPPPADVTLSPGGLLSGTPLEPGTSSFIVKVTDANSSTATHSLSLTVSTRPSLSAPHRTAGGSFVFTVNGVANQNYTVQYSSTLTNWSTLESTNSATTSFQVADPLNFKLRYYRVLVGP